MAEFYSARGWEIPPLPWTNLSPPFSHNIRDSGTLAQMRDTVAGLVGRNLLYRDLIADNGLSSGARS